MGRARIAILETGRESTMRISAFCAAVVAYVVIGHAPPAAAQVDQQRAQEYFKEAQALCERDGGRLWGVSVCAPMVIADRRTQTFATSQPAPEEARPQLLGVVNAPVKWGGATWGAYMWDDVVNRTPRERKELFLHELFHLQQPPISDRVQNLGLVLKKSIDIGVRHLQRARNIHDRQLVFTMTAQEGFGRFHDQPASCVLL